MSDHDGRYCIHMAMEMATGKSSYYAKNHDGDISSFFAPTGTCSEDCASAEDDFQGWVRSIGTHTVKAAQEEGLSLDDGEKIVMMIAKVSFIAGRIFEEQQVLKMHREDNLSL